jgi:hypothetical protein
VGCECRDLRAGKNVSDKLEFGLVEASIGRANEYNKGFAIFVVCHDCLREGVTKMLCDG